MPSESVRHPSARKVDAALESHGLIGRVRELPSSTRTAADAAGALGCEVRQIVKSLVFRREPSGSAVLALVAGDHRLDEAWVFRRTGERWVREDPEQVRATAGFAIGGVPPIGHPAPLPTVIDYDLLEQREVWAAAGHPNAVCRIASPELLRITHGQPMAVVPLTGTPAGTESWISFDCYGTIIDWRTPLVEGLGHLLGPVPPPAGERFFEAYLEKERVLEARPYRPYREILSDAVREAAEELGYSLQGSAPDSLAETIPEWPAFPDSKEALDDLRASGWKVAVLSNIDRNILDRTLHAHDLKVDLTVTAEDVRSYKPEFAHWIRFLKTTGIAPEQGWHASGGFDYDIPPASLLGFRTAYIGRYGPAPATLDRLTVHSDLAAFARHVKASAPPRSEHSDAGRP